jgi:hypothetical protein
VCANLASHSTARHAADLVARAAGGDWSVLVTSNEGTAAAAREAKRQLELFSDDTPLLFEGKFSPTALLKSLAPATLGFVVVAPEDWSAPEWRQLDQMRSALPANAALVFVLSESAMLNLSLYAPNVASLLGAQAHFEKPDEGLLTEGETETRLRFFRETTGRTDEEIIQMATAGTLPPDPDYGEWLLLLNRGDLL